MAICTIRTIELGERRLRQAANKAKKTDYESSYNGRDDGKWRDT
jgi:hypothetical protein